MLDSRLDMDLCAAKWLKLGPYQLDTESVIIATAMAVESIEAHLDRA